MVSQPFLFFESNAKTPDASQGFARNWFGRGHSSPMLECWNAPHYAKRFTLTVKQPLEDNSAPESGETINMQITVFADKEFPNDWHVEAIDTKSGDIFQAVFAGPDAEDRAREYADWQRSKQLVAEAA
jgi:hypothetical protein